MGGRKVAASRAAVRRGAADAKNLRGPRHRDQHGQLIKRGGGPEGGFRRHRWCAFIGTHQVRLGSDSLIPLPTIPVLLGTSQPRPWDELGRPARVTMSHEVFGGAMSNERLGDAVLSAGLSPASI